MEAPMEAPVEAMGVLVEGTEVSVEDMEDNG